MHLYIPVFKKREVRLWYIEGFHTHIRVLVNALRLFEVMLSLILVSEANVKYIAL